MNDLPKTILITGATSGFGKETAKIFIKNGWKVIITGRRGNRLEDLTRELGNNCLPLCFDITDRVAVKKEISRILPVLKKVKTLKKNKVLISLDTRKSKVVGELQGIGVDIINVLSGFRYDIDMVKFLIEKIRISEFKK